jgi:hypothetical protein
VIVIQIENNRVVVRVEVEFPPSRTEGGELYRHRDIRILRVVTPFVVFPIPGSEAWVVPPDGTICACGYARQGNPPLVPIEFATTVYALVYQGIVNPPAMPPTGTPSTNPDQVTGYWQFDALSGAAANDGPNFPTNTLAIWYVWPSNPNSYDSEPVNFLGENSDMTDCG